MSALGKFVGLLAGQPAGESAPVKKSAPAKVPVESVKLKLTKYDRSMLKKWIVMLAWYRADIHREEESRCTDSTWEKIVQAAKEGKKEDIEIPILFKPTQKYHEWGFVYDHRNRDEYIPWYEWYELSPYEREMYTPAIHITVKGENGGTVYDKTYDRFHKTDPNFAQRFHDAFWKLAEPLLDMKLDKNQVDFTDSVPEKIQGGNMPQTAIGDGKLCEAVFRWKLSPADFAKLSNKKKKKLLKQLCRIEELLHEAIQALVNAGDNEPKRESSPKKDEPTPKSKDKEDVPVSDYTKYQGKGTIRPLSAWEKLADDKTKAGAEVGLLQFKGEIKAGAYDGISAEGADACQMLAARAASGKCVLDPPKFLLDARDEDIKVLAAMSDGSGS